jgi:alkaline phosphatase D
MPIRISVSRRRFLATAAASTALSAIGGLAKPYLSRAADRPLITHGIQSGDVSVDSAVIWARADRPARMLAKSQPRTASKPSTTRFSSMRCPNPISPPRR